MPQLFEWDGTKETNLYPFEWNGSSENALTLFDDASTPTPPPPVAPSPEIVGIYNGTFGSETPDANTFATFGVYPPIASSYMVSDNPIRMSDETARVNRGTRPQIGIGTKGSTVVTLHDIANNTTVAQTWMDGYINNLKTLSEVDVNLPVYAALEMEFEVKVNQGQPHVAGVTEQIYAQALDVWHTRVHANAPLVRTKYWFGGSDWQAIGLVLSNMTVAPKTVGFDPYRNPGDSSTATFANKAGPKLATLRGLAGYIALGSPPAACSETGTDIGFGDASVAAYIDSIKPGCKALGLQYAVYFNRNSGATNNCNINNLPLSVAALAAAMSS